MRRACAIAIVAALSCAPGLAAGAPSAAEASAVDPRLADAQRLQQWRCGPSFTMPAGGIEIVRDVARLRLGSGSVRLFEPTGADHRVGLAFEGEGRFDIAVPDPVEARQLARFAARPGTRGLEAAFGRLVLVTSEPLLHDLLPAAPAGGPWTACPLARERQENWLLHHGLDAGARVLAGLETPGDEYLRYELESADFGWLTFTFDGQADEEVSLDRYSTQARRPFVEAWLSLDRAADRDPRGRPSTIRRRPLSLPRVELAIDLGKSGREARQGRSDTNAVDAQIQATLRLAPRDGGARAVRLILDPEAEVRAVRDEQGRSLAYLRDRVGERSSTLHDWIFDLGLVVFLDRPLAVGEERRLTVDYHLDLDNYAPSRIWYPGLAEDPFALHTARLTITAPEKLAVRTMGATRPGPPGEGTTTVVAEVERPTAMVTFAFARRPREQTVRTGEGDFTVTAFASKIGAGENAVFNVAADVANAVQYFEQLYGLRLNDRRLVACSILGDHGQSFDGFLHLSEWTFYEEHKGPTELFRAHEVAHQIFGHRVRFASYRDQWLSEAFAEYSGLLFLEATVANGPALVREALDVNAEILAGSIQSLGSRFARPGMIEVNSTHRQRIGPIALGHRAATAEVPQAYQMQSYHRGAWALHMLRGLLRRVSKSDELFFATLRDFVHELDGREATTADFQACLERHAPGDWQWLFDQWIDSAEMPTYTWRHAISPGADGKPHLQLTVRQSGVSPGFRMPVPVRIELPGGKSGEIWMLIDQPEKSLDVPLSAKPTKVIFNPDGAILAVVKKG